MDKKIPIADFREQLRLRAKPIDSVNAFRTGEENLPAEMAEMKKELQEKKLLEYQLKIKKGDVNAFLQSKYGDGNFNEARYDGYDNTKNRFTNGITYEYHVYFDRIQNAAGVDKFQGKRPAQSYLLTSPIISPDGDRYIYHIPVHYTDEFKTEIATDIDGELVNPNSSSNSEDGLVYALETYQKNTASGTNSFSNSVFNSLRKHGFLEGNKFNGAIKGKLVERYLHSINEKKRHNALVYLNEIFEKEVKEEEEAVEEAVEEAAEEATEEAAPEAVPEVAVPQAEGPKAAPQTEAKAEAPKAEAPKAEAPKAATKTQTLKAPKAAPRTAPKTEAKAEAPKAEVPKAEDPKAVPEPPTAIPEESLVEPEKKPTAAKAKPKRESAVISARDLKSALNSIISPYVEKIKKLKTFPRAYDGFEKHLEKKNADEIDGYWQQMTKRLEDVDTSNFDADEVREDLDEIFKQAEDKHKLNREAFHTKVKEAWETIDRVIDETKLTIKDGDAPLTASDVEGRWESPGFFRFIGPGLKEKQEKEADEILDGYRDTGLDGLAAKVEKSAKDLLNTVVMVYNNFVDYDEQLAQWEDLDEGWKKLKKDYPGDYGKTATEDVESRLKAWRKAFKEFDEGALKKLYDADKSDVKNNKLASAKKSLATQQEQAPKRAKDAADKAEKAKKEAEAEAAKEKAAEDARAKAEADLKKQREKEEEDAKKATKNVKKQTPAAAPAQGPVTRARAKAKVIESDEEDDEEEDNSAPLITRKPRRL